MRSLLSTLLLPVFVLSILVPSFASASTPSATQAPTKSLPKLSICVFDPLGANGTLFNTMKDYRAVAFEWGADLQPRAYTDEKIAVDDFKAGQCDAALVTGTRARPFNKFAATIEAIGAIPDEKMLRTLLATISGPKAAKYMRNGQYEVAGVMPAGPIYLFTRDRTIDTVEELSGKRIATIDYDEASIFLVNHIGASMVPSNSANFSGKFNNGSVDIAYAPAVAYQPLELYKGLQDNGGILRFVLAYMDFQILIRADKFPEGFGQKSRTMVASYFDRVNEFVEKETQAIDSKYWIELSEENKQKYNEMLRDVRIKLRDQGAYDGKMLKLMRKLRCKANPAAAECSEKLE
jgi:hypothetical protein